MRRIIEKLCAIGLYLLIVPLVVLVVYFGLLKSYRSEKNFIVGNAKSLGVASVNLITEDGSLSDHGHGKSIFKNINSELHSIASLFGTPDLSLGRLKKMDSCRIFSDQDIVQHFVLDTGYSLVIVSSVFSFETKQESFFSTEVSKVMRSMGRQLEVVWPKNIAHDKIYQSLITSDKFNHTSRGDLDENGHFHYDFEFNAQEGADLKQSPEFGISANLSSVDNYIEVKPLDGSNGKYLWYYVERFYSKVAAVKLSGPAAVLLKDPNARRFAVSEFKRGVLPYFNQRTTAQGYFVDEQGQDLMFTFGSGFNADHSDTFFHADYAIIRGKQVFFKPVVIHYDPLNFMNSWWVVTHEAHIEEGQEPQVDLKFASVKYSLKSKEIFLLYRWKVEQVYGYWQGHIHDGQGNKILVESAVGVNENLEFKF